MANPQGGGGDLGRWCHRGQERRGFQREYGDHSRYYGEAEQMKTESTHWLCIFSKREVAMTDPNHVCPSDFPTGLRESQIKYSRGLFIIHSTLYIYELVDT
jgi:hypothetical protein